MPLVSRTWVKLPKDNPDDPTEEQRYEKREIVEHNETAIVTRSQLKTQIKYHQAKIAQIQQELAELDAL